MKQIKLYPSGKIIKCEDGETILCALENSGLMLPNNCRAGACGECKIKVRSGKYDQGFILNMALSSAEKEDGFGLMCVAKAIDNEIELEWGEIEAKPKLFETQVNKPFSLISKRYISDKIIKLELRSLGEPLRFWPGQFIKLCDEAQLIETEIYFISNTPNQLGIIEIFVEIIENNVNHDWIHNCLQEGESVSLSGAYGEFIGNANIEKPVLCIGEGVGISPIISLAEGAMIRGGFKNYATVIEVVENKDALIGQGKLLFLEKKFRNFIYKKCINTDLNLFMNKDQIVNLDKYSIYISGKTDFILSTLALLKKNGAQEDSIYFPKLH